jgi:hypothetical protein
MALQHRPPKTEELAMLLQSGSAMMGPGVRFTVHSSDLAHTSEAQRLSFLVFSQPCWRRAVRETPSENFIQSDDDVRARQLSSETDNHHQPAGARQQEEELVVEQAAASKNFRDGLSHHRCQNLLSEFRANCCASSFQPLRPFDVSS